MAAASQEELPLEAGAADDAMREREGVDPEVRQLPDHVLREKAQRLQIMLDSEMADRLRDRGKKLRLSLDAILRELNRRQGPRGGARAPVSPFSSFVVLSHRVRE